jgi:hypothetical protein
MELETEGVEIAGTAEALVIVDVIMMIGDIDVETED